MLSNLEDAQTIALLLKIFTRRNDFFTHFIL